MADPIVGKISVGDGATFVPDITNGVISWTNNKELPNPDSVDLVEAVVNDGRLAPLANPAFTGSPTAPTQATSDDSLKIANTAWVNARIGTGAVANGNTGLLTGGAAYGELRPDTDGEYVKTSNTTKANLTALDTMGKAAFKGLSASNETLTYTKGDNTTGTVTVGGSGTATSGNTGLINGGTLHNALLETAICFDNVADMVDAPLEAGQTALTRGYHTVNDGGSAFYYIREVAVGDVDDGGSIIFLDNGNVAELITDGTVNVHQFGAKGDGTTDDTIAIQNAIDFGSNIVLLDKTYLVSDTLNLFAFSSIKGISKKTFITFTKKTAPALSLLSSNNAGRCIVQNIRIVSENYIDDGYGDICINILSARNTSGEHVWKCTFDNVDIRGFSVGVNIAGETLDPPLPADYASEMLFLHCKILQCVTGVKVENTQAVNNTFVETDIESGRTNPSPYGRCFEITTGGNVNVFGGSIISKRAIATITNPTTNAAINMYACRVEALADNTDACLFGLYSNNSASLYASINVRDMLIYYYDNSITALAHVEGKGTITLENLYLAGSSSALQLINVADYISANGITGSIDATYSKVIAKNIVNSALPERKNDEFSPEIDVSGIVAPKTQRSAYGLINTDVHTVGYNAIPISQKMIVFGTGKRSYQFEKTTFALPTNTRPLKLGMCRLGTISSELNFTLYAVKNQDKWVTPGTLDVSTDAKALATVVISANNGGYAEVPISVSSAFLTVTGVETDYTDGLYFLTSNNGQKSVELYLYYA